MSGASHACETAVRLAEATNRLADIKRSWEQLGAYLRAMDSKSPALTEYVREMDNAVRSQGEYV